MKYTIKRGMFITVKISISPTAMISPILPQYLKSFVGLSRTTQHNHNQNFSYVRHNKVFSKIVLVSFKEVNNYILPHCYVHIIHSKCLFFLSTHFIYLIVSNFICKKTKKKDRNMVSYIFRRMLTLTFIYIICSPYKLIIKQYKFFD